MLAFFFVYQIGEDAGNSVPLAAVSLPSIAFAFLSSAERAGFVKGAVLVLVCVVFCSAGVDDGEVGC